MPIKSLYPDKRQKAFFESYDDHVQEYQLVTSGSITYFRNLFRLLVLIYSIFAIVSGFELLSGILVDNLSIQNKIVAPSAAGLMLVLIISMGMIHNQIVLILGHGYKSKDAQLYADRLTTKEECETSITIIRSMYVIAIVIPLVLLWFLWGMYGTPLYGGDLASQIQAMQAVIGLDKAISSDSYLIKPYLWVGTISLLLCFLMGCLGWLQASWAKSRI